MMASSAKTDMITDIGVTKEEFENTYGNLADIFRLPFPVRRDKISIKPPNPKGTAEDDRVPRDKSLLRLTGVQPFNAEAPLDQLYDCGFLTKVGLHYVRNHGGVPEISEDIMNWEVEVGGMVEHPFKFKLKEIISDYDIYTVPVSLTCAGNRRKEQNMVKRGTGFNWGSAGTSTSLWTGCMMRDIMLKAKPKNAARFVWMEGGDNPANGPYGTSVRLCWVMDPERSIMLAYKQNGSFLSPDHGRPFRAIIPGVIGGRSVKWLKKIIISDVPSNNWYHYFDNRVLPTMVTPEEAKKNKQWWKDERYALYDMAVQSAIWKPSNNETVAVSGEDDDNTVSVSGYASNGAGVRVGRVEVSLDKGRTWKLADIDYPEDRYREAGHIKLFGGLVNVCDRMSCLCWCFWKISIPKKELLVAKDIVVRAMDERMCIQPRDMYWNVTSMMNNWWYRVAIRKDGPNVIRFEHPVLANKKGGWMDRVKSEGGDFLDGNWGENDGAGFGRSDSTRRKPVVDTDLQLISNPEKMKVIITKEEFDKHGKNILDSNLNPWFLVKGLVFDGSSFLDDPPGGAEALLGVTGADATDQFMSIHSDDAKRMLATMQVGVLEGFSQDTNDNEENGDLTPGATFLRPKFWKKVELISREDVSEDSAIFTFKLETPEQKFGLPAGKHVFVKMNSLQGKSVVRTYTPISDDSLLGKMQLLIKIYRPKGDFQGGKLTSALDLLKVGESIEVKGPFGPFSYNGNGNYELKPKVENHADNILMVSGGSGITPNFVVAKRILSDCEKDHTKMCLVSCNNNECDILLRPQLEEYARKYPNSFSAVYFLSNKKTIRPDWDGYVGYVNGDALDKITQDWKIDSTLVLCCGPPPMNNAVKAWAKQKGILDDHLFSF